MTSDFISMLPSIHSGFNGLSAILLILGFIQIKKNNEIAHKKFMMGAFGSSAIFLALYLIYHYTVGHVGFHGQGIIRPIYFAILIPHVILAVAVLPFILLAIKYAIQGNREKHKKLVKITFPVWLYVSVSGVIIYVMVYHLYPAPAVMAA